MENVGQVVGFAFRMDHFGGDADHHVMTLGEYHLGTEVQERADLHRLPKEDVVDVHQSGQALAVVWS